MMARNEESGSCGYISNLTGKAAAPGTGPLLKQRVCDCKSNFLFLNILLIFA